MPEAVFCIVGMRPAPEVAKLAEQPGIMVTGGVPDVRPYLAHARAATLPLRIARGIQNKVLEAMAMQLPVIATPGAMTGIQPFPGFAPTVSEDAATLRDAAIRLLRQPRATDQAGRDCVLQRYNWDANLHGSPGCWRAARSNRISDPGGRFSWIPAYGNDGVVCDPRGNGEVIDQPHPSNHPRLPEQARHFLDPFNSSHPHTTINPAQPSSLNNRHPCTTVIIAQAGIQSPLKYPPSTSLIHIRQNREIPPVARHFPAATPSFAINLRLSPIDWYNTQVKHPRQSMVGRLNCALSSSPIQRSALKGFMHGRSTCRFRRSTDQ